MGVRLARSGGGRPRAPHLQMVEATGEWLIAGAGWAGGSVLQQAHQPQAAEIDWSLALKGEVTRRTPARGRSGRGWAAASNGPRQASCAGTRPPLEGEGPAAVERIHQ